MQYSSWGCINTKYRGRTTSSDMLAMLYLMHPKTHSWLPASGWECIWSSLFLMMQREDQDLFQLVGRAMPFGGTGKEPTRTLTWQQADAHRGLVYHQIQLQLLTCSKNAILYSSPQHVNPHLKPFPWMFERKKKFIFISDIHTIMTIITLATMDLLDLLFKMPTNSLRKRSPFYEFVVYLDIPLSGLWKYRQQLPFWLDRRAPKHCRHTNGQLFLGTDPRADLSLQPSAGLRSSLWRKVQFFSPPLLSGLLSARTTLEMHPSQYLERQ